MNRRAFKILASAAVLIAGTVFLLFSSLADGEYYKRVHELMESPQDWTGKTLRVHGFVEAGSLDERIVDQKTTRVFVLSSEGKRVVVRHHGPKPDTFRDESEVVAKGTLQFQDGRYVLEATELMAKCPSKYQGGPDMDKVNGEADKPLFAN